MITSSPSPSDMVGDQLKWRDRAKEQGGEGEENDDDDDDANRTVALIFAS